MQGVPGKAIHCNGNSSQIHHDPLALMVNNMMAFIRDGKGGRNGGRCFYPQIDRIQLVSSPIPHSGKGDDKPNYHYESTSKVAQGSVIGRIRPKMMAPHDKYLPGPVNSSLCLGCCKWYPRDSRQCSRCGWSVCSKECEQDSLHSRYECNMFQVNAVEPMYFPGLYDAILTYRIITLLEEDAQFLKVYENWKLLSGEKVNCLAEEFCSRNAPARFIKKFLVRNCRLTTNKCYHNYVDKVFHFITCNSLYQDTPASVYDIGETRNYHSAKYVFLFNHAFGQSCRPNVNHTINFGLHLNDCYLLLSTTINLDKGDKILVAFQETHTTCGTLERRRLQKQTNLVCQCDRCKDPTEFGSYASAVSCVDCKEDYLLPVSPLDDRSKWKCCNHLCNSTMEANQVIDKLQKISLDIDEVKDSLGECIKLMKGLEGILHPSHYLICKIADYIVDLGWADVKRGHITSFAFYNFEPLFQAQLKCFAFADKVSPGYTLHRSKYIYFKQMIEGIYFTQRAVYCNQNNLFTEGQLIHEKLQGVHRLQKFLINTLGWTNIGSTERYMLELLIKSESDLAELLRTSFTEDVLLPENIERLRRAFSYFCHSVYKLPFPLQVDDYISLPTVKAGMYHDFFGY